MEKGQTVELKIEDMSAEGQGIGKTDEGFVVFVDGAVVGDRVKATLTKVKKNYSFARLDGIDELSEYRNEEFDCRICGGCPYGIIEYDKQLEIKEAQVRSKLERLAGVEFSALGPIMRPIIGMQPEDNDGDGPYRYRNKAVMAVSQKKGDLKIGFNKAKSHEIADCSDCLLQPWTAAAAVMATREFMSESKAPIKGMTVRTAFGTGQVMVVYDVYDKASVQKIAAKAEHLIDLLDEAIYNLGSYDDGEPAFTLESIALRYEKGSPSKGSGGRKSAGGRESSGPAKTETVILAGSNTIVDEMVISGDAPDRCDSSDARVMKFEISPDSFYQVNTTQMQRLYNVVRQYVKKAIDDKKPVILDLYCGVGTIGLCMADLAERVIGIESVRDAVIDANRNAVINGIVNAVYVCGKAEEEIANVLSGSDGAGFDSSRQTIAILDPPRAGCRPELLEAIAKAGGRGVDNIIYVSCDPATLGRDVKLLLDYGYELKEATPVDMFPHTGHVETVALIQKRKSN